MTNTLQRKLEDLRYKTGLLTEALQSATDLTYEDSPGSMDAVDRCIDLWNEVINLAPGTLKRVKLHLCDIQDAKFKANVEAASKPETVQQVLDSLCPVCGHEYCCHKEGKRAPITTKVSA